MKKSKKLYWLFLIPLLFIPMVFTNGYHIRMIDTILVYVVATIGLNFITGMTGENNLGMAGIFALGAYTSAIVSMKLNTSPFIGLLAACLMGVIVGQLLGRPSLRVKGIYLALTTLMFGEVVRLVLNNLVSLTEGPTGIRSIPCFSVLGYALNNDFKLYYLYLAICAAVIWVAQKLIHGRWGREFMAIRDNEDAVESCGVSIARTKIIAFTLCSMLGCMSGSMYAHMIQYIVPSTFDFNFMVKFMMMLMLGGIGSIPGCILGAVIVVLVPELLRGLGDYYWFVFSVLMLLLILWKPYGLVSVFTDAGRKFKEGKQAVIKKEGV